MNIHFKKINLTHKETIWQWLSESHIQASWDNSQAHKDDIINFMHGRKEPSSYANGQYVYWIAFADNIPFAMLMIIQETPGSDINDIKLRNLSKTGNSYGIDYMIGDPHYYGKGYGAITLSGFVDFFRTEIDPKADTFLIDPALDNPRAKHVYLKAGFQYIGDFMMEGNVSGVGQPHCLLIKKFSH